VADTLRRLHLITQGWPQRPGWRSSTDLLHAEKGTRIDLDAMPPEGVARCRAAWARLIGRQTCVVHGDANPRNIRMTANRVGLIDWDGPRKFAGGRSYALVGDGAMLMLMEVSTAVQYGAQAVWVRPARQLPSPAPRPAWRAARSLRRLRQFAPPRC